MVVPSSPGAQAGLKLASTLALLVVGIGADDIDAALAADDLAVLAATAYG